MALFKQHKCLYRVDTFTIQCQVGGFMEFENQLNEIAATELNEGQWRFKSATLLRTEILPAEIRAYTVMTVFEREVR